MEGEFEPDRIGGEDDGKERSGKAGAACHQVPWRYTPVADATAHRSSQFGEFEIKRGLANQGLICRHRGLGITKRLRALLEHLLADGALAHQLLAAGEVSLGKDEIGFCSLDIGAGLVERVLEGPLI